MDSKADYIESLVNCGYKVIGKGAWAHILCKPKSRTVVKVGDINDACLTYIEAIQGSQHKCFPKIYKIQKHESFYVADMERLQKVSRDEDFDVVDALDSHKDSWQAVKITFLKEFNLRPAYTVVRKIIKEQPKKQIKGGFSMIVDLSIENLMWRKRGGIKELVVTDPIA